MKNLNETCEQKKKRAKPDNNKVYKASCDDNNKICLQSYA